MICQFQILFSTLQGDEEVIKNLRTQSDLLPMEWATSEIHNITENSSSAYPIDYYATYLPIIEEVDLDSTFATFS